jgi:tRNA A-37 threonylcarbamoyl transferase component Bud32
MEHFRGKPLESENSIRVDPSTTGEQRLKKIPSSPKPREWRISNGSAGVATVSRGYAIQVASDVASGLRYLHASLQICHGDLHPHNVLAAPDGAACISDFGSAFRYHPEERRVWEPVDVRGLGVVLRSLEERTVQPEEDLVALSTSCLMENPLNRPDLDAVISRLQRMQYGKFCE